MSFARVTLESFESGGAFPPKEGPDYQRGFKDGVEFAAQSDAAAVRAAVSDMSATLSDMTFGFTEARLHLLDRIRPILAQIAEALLPDIAREVFAAHLVETLLQSFEAAADQPIQIAVAPSDLAAVGSALASADGRIRLQGDAGLAIGQAVLCRDETHILIDLPALTGALQTALLGLEPSERTLANG